MKAIPKMECGDPKNPKKLDCKQFLPVTTCGKRPTIISCQKPLRPVKAMMCVPHN